MKEIWVSNNNGINGILKCDKNKCVLYSKFKNFKIELKVKCKQNLITKRFCFLVVVFGEISD